MILAKRDLALRCYQMRDNRKKTIDEFIRYSIIGLANNSFGYLLFLLISYHGVEYKLTMSILYATSTFFSFLGNWKWVFKHNQYIIPAIAKFLMVYFLGYLINLFLLIYFADQLGYSYLIVQVIAMFIIAIFLFVMFKFVVFIPNKTEIEGDI
jgi:putative flippase GtrA